MCRMIAFNTWTSNKRSFLLTCVMILMRISATSTAVTNTFDTIRPNCTRTVSKCEPLMNTVCLGTTLPYQLTSTAHVSESGYHRDIASNLQRWRGLQNVPKCWEVVQPLICAVYMPKCVTNNVTNVSVVYMPAKELCEKTREPCRIVDKYNGWLDFLKCDHEIFVPGCQNEVVSARFNTTAHCEAPLVATNNAKSWHPDIDGCAIKCQNPIYTDQEHEQVHIFIAFMGSVCLACTLFAAITFLFEWKVMSRYPGVIVFFINICFFIGTVGWMAQFVPGARRDIVCRGDGTTRKAEPQISSGESSTCMIIFIVVYFFMMAGVTWFVILTYALNLTYGALGSTRDVIEGRRGHFHLFAWSVPLVLTIVCLALSQVDGDSLTGICFVGFVSDMYRGGLVLLPIGLCVVIGLTFLIRGLFMLVRIRNQSPGLISEEASARIRDTVIRLGFFAVFILSFTIVTFAVHVYIFLNGSDWQTSMDEYIACRSNITSLLPLSNPTVPCTIKSRPNVVAAKIHVFVYFAAGIIMSSWVWDLTTLKSWKRNLKKLICLSETADADAGPVDHPKKSDIMPNLFVIQKEVNQTCRSSSFNSNREDALAMNQDLTSVTSRELSSSWGPTFQRMLMCRSGLHSGVSGRQRRYSDSDVQSISSLFEQMGLSDAQSRQGHLRLSQNGSHNDSTSFTTASHRIPAVAAADVAKPKRHGHRKKNQVVPAVDPVTAKSQKVVHGKVFGKEPLEFNSRHLTSDRTGYASSLAGCSSLACGSSFAGRSSFSGRSSVMAGSSTAGGSSFVGASSIGSDTHPESPVSRSEGSELGDGGNDAEAALREKSVPQNSVKQKDQKENLTDKTFLQIDDDEGDEESGKESDGTDAEDDGVSGSRSPSNFTIASSDTEALSIKLDNNYQPVDSGLSDPPQLQAIPPSANVIKVSPIKPVAVKPLFDLPTSNNKPPAPGQMMHNSTQTSGFLSPFPGFGFHSPYSTFNYGPYLPLPPMYYIPNSETPIWPPPPFGYPAVFYPPFFEPGPCFPYPPSYYSQFTPPPAPCDLARTAQHNEEVMGVPSVVPVALPSQSVLQQTSNSQVSCGKPQRINEMSTVAFRSTVQSRSREYEGSGSCSKSLLEMVELMTSQMDSATEASDSDSTSKWYEINTNMEARRKSKRRQRHHWLKTLTVNSADNCSDTSV